MLTPLRHRDIGSLVLIPAAYAIRIDATLWLCSGIVLMAIAAQLLSRQVRELPRLPPGRYAGSVTQSP